MRTIKPFLTILCAAALLTACTSMSGGSKIDYRNNKSGNQLEIPPELTNTQIRPKYAVPGQTVQASSAFNNQPDQTIDIAPNETLNNSFHTDGEHYWVMSTLPINTIWDLTSAFWQEHGFTIKSNEPEIGVMQTYWAENRANLPRDAISRAISSVLPRLQETGLRDRFKTNIRQTSSGTLIVVRHEGMKEVYTNKGSGGLRGNKSTAWQPRERDSELEIEMLRRLMLFLGGQSDN